jgi:hypothetical protein
VIASVASLVKSGRATGPEVSDCAVAFWPIERNNMTTQHVQLKYQVILFMVNSAGYLLFNGV